MGIVCNARGPGVVCADACADAGSTSRACPGDPGRAARVLPPTSVVAGPVQLVAAESPAGFRAAVEHVAADPAVDAVIAIFVEHIATGADEVAAALAAAAPALHAAGTPLLAVFMTPGALPTVLRGRTARAPTATARSPSGRKVPDASGRPRPPPARSAAPRPTARFRGATPPPSRRRLDDVDARRRGRRSSPASLARGGGWLRPDEVEALLGAYGIALVEQRRVSSVARRRRPRPSSAAPVALKGIAPGVVHKAQAGAVRLGLCRPDRGPARGQDIARGLEAAGTPVEDFLVQRMAGPGVEMLVGVLADERFGPVVACGAGGGTAEVLDDVQVRLAPLALEDAHA